MAMFPSFRNLLKVSFLLLMQVVAHLTDAKVVMCYYTNWSQYRRTPVAPLLPRDIDPWLCTHLIYAYSFVDPATTSLMYTEMKDPEFYREMVQLKEINQDLKVLLSVGGYNYGVVRFLSITQQNSTIDIFAQNVIGYLRQYGFDGLDVSWQWPDRQTRVFHEVLLQRLRSAFEDEALSPGRNRLILTAAVSGDANQIGTSYRPEVISYLVDYILVMTFDYFGTWSRQLAHHSPLYVRQEDANRPDIGRYSMNQAVRTWVENGATRDKVVPGLAAHGRVVELYSRELTDIGSRVGFGVPMGPYTRAPGYMAFYEVCEKLSDGWTRQFVFDSRVPYAYSTPDQQWVCYDDPASFRTKAEYVVTENLGGVVVWAVDLDDFSSYFCNSGRFPLISQLRDVFDLPYVNLTTTRRTTVTTTTAPTTTTTTRRTSPTSTTTSTTTTTTTTTPSTTTISTTTLAPPTTTTSAPTSSTTSTTSTTTTTTPVSTTTTSTTTPTSTTTTTSPLTTTMTSPTTTTTFTTSPSTTTRTTSPTTTPSPTTTSSTTTTSVTTSSTTTTTTTTTPATTTTPTTTTTRTTTQGVNYCPEPFSFYRNPEDCASFIRCTFSKPSFIACPVGTLFNDQLKICDNPFNVDCSNG